MKNTNGILEIQETYIYGSVRTSNRLDMKEILGNKILDYRIKKIRCQLKKDESISGIQFIYENVNDGSLKSIIDYKSKEVDIIEQEFELNNENIKGMNVYLNSDIINRI